MAQKKIDPDVCPRCNSRNTNRLEKNTHECYDCGRSYKVARKRPVKNTNKAGNVDRALVKASLEVQGLVSVCGYKLTEKELYPRIIDKIPGAQFHKIIMAIAADLKKENS